MRRLHIGKDKEVYQSRKFREVFILAGGILHVDFSGPFEVSMQGNIYVVLFVDRATRLIVGIFVRNKNEDTAVEVMKKFIETNLSPPRFSGTDLIFVQSDNGEMHSEKVRLYSWANGIFNDLVALTIVYRTAQLSERSRKSRTLGGA